MIIFLHGEDVFRSSRKVSEIKQKFLEKDQAGSGLSIFDYSEKKSEPKPLDVLGMPNLLAPKRLVIIKNLLTDGSQDWQTAILEYLEKEKNIQKDNDLVVIFWEKGKLKKGLVLAKWLEKNAKTQAFEKLSGAKLNNWAIQRFKELNPSGGISHPALEKLLAFTGEDSFALDMEIRKLTDYTFGRTVKEGDVDQLVHAKFDANIFATVDALGARDKKTALELLHRHLAAGDDPFYLLSMFVYQFRNLLKIIGLKEEGMSEGDIIRATKLHPFVVKKGLAQGRNFSLAALKNIYAKLAEMDRQIKIGKLEIKLALDKFIAEL